MLIYVDMLTYVLRSSMTIIVTNTANEHVKACMITVAHEVGLSRVLQTEFAEAGVQPKGRTLYWMK